MSNNIKAENINNDFFKGYYKEIWRHIFPEKTTKAEADFLVEAGGLKNNSRVLDLMCGYGRHALELASRGIQVTAVDNLPEYIEEIKEKSAKENLGIECFCEDVLEFETDKEFDAIICMGNSLQFFNEQDNLSLLSNLSNHIKQGGKFFINSWSLAEIVNNQPKNKSWNRIGGLLFLTESKMLQDPNRMETASIIISESGEREEKTGIDFIYSINELEVILKKSGFRLVEVYSIPGKKIFSPGDPRAYIVSEKI